MVLVPDKITVLVSATRKVEFSPRLNQFIATDFDVAVYASMSASVSESEASKWWCKIPATEEKA